MRAKRWGVFLCNCRSTLEVDAARIESSAALVTVASQPEQEVQAFAEQVEQQEVEQVVVGCCCAERSVFETALKGKTLRFLDLKGNCFSPHSDTAQAHAKAQKMIRAEMQASSIQAQHPVPVNPLLVRNRVVLYTEFPEGLEMVGLLKDLVEEGPEGLTVCVAGSRRECHRGACQKSKCDLKPGSDHAELKTGGTCGSVHAQSLCALRWSE